MSKFKINDDPDAVFDVFGRSLKGGTWYTSGDVGATDELIMQHYPIFQWDSKPNILKKEIPKPKSEEVPKKEILKSKKKKKK